MSRKRPRDSFVEIAINGDDGHHNTSNGDSLKEIFFDADLNGGGASSGSGIEYSPPQVSFYTHMLNGQIKKKL